MWEKPNVLKNRPLRSTIEAGSRTKKEKKNQKKQKKKKRTHTEARETTGKKTNKNEKKKRVFTASSTTRLVNFNSMYLEVAANGKPRVSKKQLPNVPAELFA